MEKLHDTEQILTVKLLLCGVTNKQGNVDWWQTHNKTSSNSG